MLHFERIMPLFSLGLKSQTVGGPTTHFFWVNPHSSTQTCSRCTIDNPHELKSPDEGDISRESGCEVMTGNAR